jgi:hypothetical protein
MREISLTQGQIALVDDEDYEYLSQWKWQARKAKNGWYARRWTSQRAGKRYIVGMHTEIMGCAPSQLVDHEDGDGLNNQRSNLRFATTAQNALNQPARNRSGYKGVRLAQDTGKWRAVISLGSFDSPEEAARAYDAAALIHHGEFARLNFGANHGT